MEAKIILSRSTDQKSLKSYRKLGSGEGKVKEDEEYKKRRRKQKIKKRRRKPSRI